MANHLFLTETEGAKDNLKYTVGAKDLLIDLKVLLKEYYAATFTEDGSSLIMKFTNGQVFCLNLKEEVK
jgi:hypothetical protein